MVNEYKAQVDFTKEGGLAEQLDFIKNNKTQGGLSGFISVQGFLRSIRDIGYKSVGRALNELIDNSIQAGCAKIQCSLVEYKNNVVEIRLVDDGHGMPEKMLPVAIRWGATHRHGSRVGFGRYGFGLPSACMSLGTKYSVYSKTADNGWNKITFDITDIALGKEDIDFNKIEIGPESLDKLPDALEQYSSMESGTIIQIENLDRIRPKKKSSLKDQLLREFGLTYYNYFPQRKITVDNTLVVGIDPLFVTPGLRGYKEEEINNLTVNMNDYVEQLIPVKVRGTDTEKSIQIRFAKFPAGFAAKPDKNTADSSSLRFKVLKENQGIIFKRLGRRMDLVKEIPGYTLQNYDRYWMCEIDFPPELDDEFEVTTSKQQVIPRQSIWDTIADKTSPNLWKMFSDAYKDIQLEAKLRKDKLQSSTDEKIADPAEVAAEESKLNEGAEQEVVERENRAKQRKEEIIKEISEKNKISIEQAEVEYKAQFSNAKYRVTTEKSGEFGKVFRFDEHGDERAVIQVIINEQHPFYLKYYSRLEKKEKQAWNMFFFSWADRSLIFDTDDQGFLNNFLWKISERFSSMLNKYSKNTGIDEEMDDELPTDDGEVKLDELKVEHPQTIREPGIKE